ncbi:hypothetical protein J437_LFUL003948, partial [Ladona fulva]
VFLSGLNIYSIRNLQQVNSDCKSKNVQFVIPKRELVLRLHGRSIGHLKHVVAVFERLGYVLKDNDSNWDVIWSHEYPFQELKADFLNLKPHQKVNHFPGSGYITNKVSLATSDVAFIPKSFKIPDDKKKLTDFANRNPEAMFVQKSNSHRGIEVKKINSLDLVDSGSFVQEYVKNPLLIDGHKFDVGVYTILTSIEPLRVYSYKGDALFRFCTEKYNPFDPTVLEKYVVGDDYLPIWEVPSLKNFYVNLGFSMKDSFDAYIQALGQDPERIWDQIDEAIANVYLSKEPLLIKSASRFEYKHYFFEMVRFDFIITEDLKVLIMEANMSPNLSSAHYPQNALLYEQVLFNLLSLVGVGSRTSGHVSSESSLKMNEMQVSLKNIAVEAEMCSKSICLDCLAPECFVCKPCLTSEMMETLKRAYLEHENRLSCRRVFPPPIHKVREILLLC